VHVGRSVLTGAIAGAAVAFLLAAGVGVAGAATGSGGTPCTATAKACVDLSAQTAWLMDGAGRVVRGPVPIRAGDRANPTPTGTFRVEWKAERYTSREYLTQMPWSVFFAPGGVAFHQGPLDTPSAGCVKLLEADARAWFAALAVGDEVQVT
jgi:lipoprotein-anchoring transpeptidase ErfK/SrfK